MMHKPWDDISLLYAAFLCMIFASFVFRDRCSTCCSCFGEQNKLLFLRLCVCLFAPLLHMRHGMGEVIILGKKILAFSLLGKHHSGLGWGVGKWVRGGLLGPIKLASDQQCEPGNLIYIAFTAIWSEEEESSEKLSSFWCVRVTCACGFGFTDVVSGYKALLSMVLSLII